VLRLGTGVKILNKERMRKKVNNGGKYTVFKKEKIFLRLRDQELKTIRVK